MRIHVTLYGELRRYHPQRGAVDVPNGATVAALLTALGVDDRHPRIVAVNDETVAEDHILADGDHLEAFHAVAGGQADGEPHGRPDANRWLGEPA